jgi:Holliday junction resolvasome RuvABC ATP-dependent DNA helicase subunit
MCTSCRISSEVVAERYLTCQICNLKALSLKTSNRLGLAFNSKPIRGLAQRSRSKHRGGISLLEPISDFHRVTDQVQAQQEAESA